MLKREESVWVGVLLGIVLMLGAGCGSTDSGPATASVSGSVTFGGEAVGEGTIVFEAAETGHGGEATLESDGAYKIELPVGSYSVIVQPPMIEVAEDPDTDPSMEYKEVANIPEKYWAPETSDLKAEVTESGATANFELQP
jgi:hypothetical protein